MAERFRVGIVGAGGVVDLYHGPVLRELPSVDLAWICDKDPAKAALLARHYGARQALGSVTGAPDVDAVLVAIPVGLRAQVLDACFARGWNVLCEKPFAATVMEHDRIVAAAAEAGVQVGVGLMRRFYRPVRAARRLVRDGIFGKLREVIACEGAAARGFGRGADWYQNDRAAAGGGVLIETGSHLVDQALFAAGLTEVADVRARLDLEKGLDLDAVVRARCSGSGHDDVVDVSIAVSRLRDLCCGIFLRFESARLKVDLSCDGRVYLTDQRYRPVTELAPDGVGAFEIYQAFRLEWEAFIAQCRGALDSDVDARSARTGIAIIDGAYAAVEAVS